MVLIALMFMAAVSYAFYGEYGAANRKESHTLISPTKPAFERSLIAEEDSDGDGMPDWEEAFLGMDPGDPNDTLKEAFVIATATPRTDNIDANEPELNADTPTGATRVAARELFSSYMYTLREQQDLSPTEQAELVQDAFEVSYASIQIPTFDPGTLAVVPASRESVTVYLTETYAVFSELAQNAPNEYAMLTELTQGDGEHAAEGLRGAVALYAEYADRLAAVTVPEDALAMHANIIDAILKYNFTLESLAGIYTDPVQAAAGLKLLLAYEGNMREAFAAYSTYVNAAGQRYASSSVPLSMSSV